MNSLNEQIREYKNQLNRGYIQKAYKSIMNFRSDLKNYLEKNYLDYIVNSLYFGYMDMTFFAFTPSHLKNRKLKIAIVFLHEQGRFEAWLGGSNRKIQADYIERMSHKDIGNYKLSKVLPGVDSIIESILVEKPDFNNLDSLKLQIEKRVIKFIADITSLLSE
jgi:hypothetical protein